MTRPEEARALAAKGYTISQIAIDMGIGVECIRLYLRDGTKKRDTYMKYKFYQNSLNRYSQVMPIEQARELSKFEFRRYLLRGVQSGASQVHVGRFIGIERERCRQLLARNYSYWGDSTSGVKDPPRWIEDIFRPYDVKLLRYLQTKLMRKLLGFEYWFRLGRVRSPSKE